MQTAFNARIQNITSKGQITLPVVWRRKTEARQIILRVKGDMLEIAPAALSVRRERKEKEYTVFDALRDNKGRGLKASDLLTLLEKMNA